MKIKRSYLGLVIIAFLAFSSQLSALPTNPIEPEKEAEEKSFVESLETFIIQRKSQRKQKIQKLFAKGKAKLAKAIDVDFDDPVNKWLWYAIIAAGISIAFSILALFFRAFRLIRYLSYLASVVCFAIWIVKYLE